MFANPTSPPCSHTRAASLGGWRASPNFWPAHQVGKTTFVRVVALLQLRGDCGHTAGAGAEQGINAALMLQEVKSCKALQCRRCPCDGCRVNALVAIGMLALSLLPSLLCSPAVRWECWRGEERRCSHLRAEKPRSDSFVLLRSGGNELQREFRAARTGRKKSLRGGAGTAAGGGRAAIGSRRSGAARALCPRMPQGGAQGGPC